MPRFRAMFLAATTPHRGGGPFLGGVCLPCVRVVSCLLSVRMFPRPSVHDNVFFFVGIVLEMFFFCTCRYGRVSCCKRIFSRL